VGADIELQPAFVDHAGIAFGAGNSHFLTIAQFAGGVTATDHSRNPQLAGDDRGVAGAAAAVGNDSAGALHDWLPIRVGHVRHQHITGLNLVHFRHVTDDLHRACADTLADRPAFYQHRALILQQIAFHDVDIAAALDRFRTSLNDVQLIVVPVLGPLNCHRTAKMLLDNHGLAGQADNFLIAQPEACAFGGIHIHGFDRAASAGLFAVNHLDRLATEVAAQDGWAPRFQGRLVNIE